MQREEVEEEEEDDDDEEIEDEGAEKETIWMSIPDSLLETEEEFNETINDDSNTRTMNWWTE